MANDPEFSSSPELRRALKELVEAGWRSVAAYRAAEPLVADHRVRTALHQLRRDHARQTRELAMLLGEDDTPASAEPNELGGPVGEWVGRGEIEEAALLAALRSAEEELRVAYERQVERGYIEPFRALLSRHRRVEEAHEAWLKESGVWRRIGGGCDIA
jgi:hypothetical protein